MDSRMNSVRVRRPTEHHLARLVGQQRNGHGGREKRGGVVALPQQPFVQQLQHYRSVATTPQPPSGKRRKRTGAGVGIHVAVVTGSWLRSWR